MRSFLLLSLLIGCAHRPVQPRDATLPEYREPIEAQEPEALLEALTAQLDPGPRARAIDALIRYAPEPGGHPYVQRGLWDPSPWVQRAAVQALAARAPEPEAAALLRDYVLRENTDPYVRGLAGHHLPPGRAPDAAEALSAACHGGAPLWQRAPLCLAAAHHGDSAAIPPLADALAHSDLPLDVDFLLAVGASGIDALIPALRKGAERVEEELRLPYAVARIGLGDPSGEQPLRLALSAPDPELRLEALDYVRGLDDPIARPLLRRAQSQGPELLSWYAQLELAARTGDFERIERGIAHADREVRELAVDAAVKAWHGSLGTKRASRMAQRVLTHALVDPAPSVRRAALEALEFVPLDGAEEAATHHLAHALPELRLAAARALLSLRR